MANAPIGPGSNAPDGYLLAPFVGAAPSVGAATAAPFNGAAVTSAAMTGPRSPLRLLSSAQRCCRRCAAAMAASQRRSIRWCGRCCAATYAATKGYRIIIVFNLNHYSSVFKAPGGLLPTSEAEVFGLWFWRDAIWYDNLVSLRPHGP